MATNFWLSDSLDFVGDLACFVDHFAQGVSARKYVDSARNPLWHKDWHEILANACGRGVCCKKKQDAVVTGEGRPMNYPENFTVRLGTKYRTLLEAIAEKEERLPSDVIRRLIARRAKETLVEPDGEDNPPEAT
jgi:hypothetical protein